MIAPDDNPLLAPWIGPFGGVPPLDRIRPAHFPPALEAAMAAYRAEIDAIAADPSPPTFANTFEALERAGAPYRRVAAMLGLFTSAMNDPAMRAVQRAWAPKLAAFRDEIIQNAALFARLEAVHAAAGGMDLTGEQRRLVEVVRRRFAREGAALADADKAELARINRRLAELQTAFRQNVLADEEAGVLVLDDPADLAGLPPDLVEAAAAAAARRGLSGRWAIENTRSSIEPFLAFADRRDLRERAFRLFVGRADGGGESDNKAVIAELLRLRRRKARLLGRPSFAHWASEAKMSATPEAAMDLLRRVWAPAAAKAREELAAFGARAAADGLNGPLEPWDVRYFARRTYEATFGFGEETLKPYLQLDRLREGMFWAAGELFGLSFERRADVPVYHPDVEVFEVTREGRHVGLWVFDLFARPGKSSGAWMSEYRTQQRLAGETPIVSNNANFIPGAPGEPVLITWSDATTLFHEFGHGLHGLLSDVTYPSLAGTSVLHDVVELPSQLFEHWLATDELLSRFAVHARSGEPLPRAGIEALLKARFFRKGFDTVEYLACAILDLEAHLEDETDFDAAAFERTALERLGMPREIALRHRLPQFTHVFASESYACGYYDYLWADVLTADAAEAFAEAPGGFYDRDLAGRLQAAILSVGGSVDPAEAWRAFRGREPDIGPLLRDRGFMSLSEEV